MFSTDTIIIVNTRKNDFESYNESIRRETIFSEAFVKHFFS